MRKWARLRARRSTENAIAMCRKAVRDSPQTQGDLLLAYLVELDDCEKRRIRADTHAPMSSGRFRSSAAPYRSAELACRSEGGSWTLIGTSRRLGRSTDVATSTPRFSEKQ